MSRAAAVEILTGVPAPMRDGVVLRADVYRPSGPGPFPALLTRTPYGRRLPGASAWIDPVRAAGAGFIVAVQDVRGRFGSEGAFAPLRHERDDGFDSVQWAATLPGANGRVGMFGLSYWGATQWLAAAARPPALAAIAPGLCWSGPRDGLLGRGGATELGAGVVWALEQGIDTLRRRGEPTAELVAALDSLPAAGPWELTTDAVARRFGIAGLHAAGDAAEIAAAAGATEVPVLSIGGWFDGLLQGTLDNHAIAGGSLVVGPWAHANFSDAVGAAAFGTAARRDGGPAGGPDDLTERQLAWLRAQLDPAAPAPAPLVRVFEMGADRWREYERWPPPGTRSRRWRLTAAGGLDERPPADPGADRGTSARARSDPAERVLHHDPADPVPTTGGATVISPRWPAGPLDQAAIEARRDVLVFTSEPLPAPLTIAGRVRVSLAASASTVTADFVARLCVVDAAGRSLNLCDGIVRSEAAPDTPRRLEVDLWSTHHRVAPGQRLRLQIASSNHPRWDATPEPGARRISCAADAASWLELQVLG